MRRLLYNSSHCSITSRAYALEPVLLKVYSSRGEPVPRCMDALAQSKPKRIPRPCKQCLARSCMGERKLSTVSKSHAASHKPVTSFQGVVPSTRPTPRAVASGGPQAESQVLRGANRSQTTLPRAHLTARHHLPRESSSFAAPSCPGSTALGSLPSGERTIHSERDPPGSPPSQVGRSLTAVRGSRDRDGLHQRREPRCDVRELSAQRLDDSD